MGTSSSWLQYLLVQLLDRKVFFHKYVTRAEDNQNHYFKISQAELTNLHKVQNATICRLYLNLHLISCYILFLRCRHILPQAKLLKHVTNITKKFTLQLYLGTQFVLLKVNIFLLFMIKLSDISKHMWSCDCQKYNLLFIANFHE